MTTLTAQTLFLSLLTVSLATFGCDDDRPASDDLGSSADQLACEAGVDACGDQVQCTQPDGTTTCVDADACESGPDGALACNLDQPMPSPVQGSDELIACDDGLADAPVAIDAARLDGDRLTLTVSYSGGCAEHGFSLCWDESFLESYPVQVHLNVHHDDGGDACEAYLTEDITIDVSSLRERYEAGYRDQGPITVHVGGHSLEYAWAPAPSGEPAIEVCGPNLKEDAVDVSSVTIDGETLVVDVGYSGGCADHAFTLCWDGSFLESNPVQAHATLAHNAGGDACEAYLSESLRFDLGPLRAAYEAGYRSDTGTVILQLAETTNHFNF